MLEHFCATFGDPSCSGFSDIVRTNRQTNRQTKPSKNRTLSTAISMSKYQEKMGFSLKTSYVCTNMKLYLEANGGAWWDPNENASTAQYADLILARRHLHLQLRALAMYDWTSDCVRVRPVICRQTFTHNYCCRYDSTRIPPRQPPVKLLSRSPQTYFHLKVKSRQKWPIVLIGQFELAYY